VLTNDCARVIFFLAKYLVPLIFSNFREVQQKNFEMTCCLTEADEGIVSRITESARLLADQSENEVEATAKINQLASVKIESICPNKTGSFTFHLLINLEGDNRTKKVSITKRFHA